MLAKDSIVWFEVTWETEVLDFFFFFLEVLDFLIYFEMDINFIIILILYVVCWSTI